MCASSMSMWSDDARYFTSAASRRFCRSSMRCCDAACCSCDCLACASAALRSASSACRISPVKRAQSARASARSAWSCFRLMMPRVSSHVMIDPTTVDPDAAAIMSPGCMSVHPPADDIEGHPGGADAAVVSHSCITAAHVDTEHVAPFAERERTDCLHWFHAGGDYECGVVPGRDTAGLALDISAALDQPVFHAYLAVVTGRSLHPPGDELHVHPPGVAGVEGAPFAVPVQEFGGGGPGAYEALHALAGVRQLGVPRRRVRESHVQPGRYRQVRGANLRGTIRRVG